MKSQDFLVSNLDLGSELSTKVLFANQFSLEVWNHKMVLFASFISLTNFLSPLVLINESCLLIMESSSYWSRHSHVTFSTILAHGLLYSMIHFKVLLVALKHIVCLLIVKLTQSFNNLILTWEVNFIEGFLHLCLQFDILSVNLLNPLIFWINKEFEILTFILEGSQCLFPLKITWVSLFFGLNHIQMKFVIFLGDLLIFLLQR